MKGSDETDQDFKVGMSNEDRRMNADSEMSGSSPAGTGEARLLFFSFFLLSINGQQRQALFFNKILLSSVPVLFTL